MYPNPFFYIITISALVAIFYYKKFKDTKYVYFIYFIFFTFLIDKLNYINRIVGFIAENDLPNNKPIINFYIIVTFYFFLSFYKTIFHRKKHKKIMNFFIFLYTFSILIDLFYFKTNFLHNFLARTVFCGSILLVLSLFLITKEILSQNVVLDNIESYFIFWISLGCFLFYLGIIPTLISSKFQLFHGDFKYILIILNSFAHISFIIGFIISDKKHIY